jgi:hypothetical protein
VFVLALLAGSCGPHKQPVHPVHGRVLYREAPATGALVVFHPAGDSTPQAVRPSGEVRADGSFALGSYRPGDGAPPGEYVVAIHWPNAVVRPSARDRIGSSESKAAPTDRLGERYSPLRSPLRARVKEGENRLEPFHIE